MRLRRRVWTARCALLRHTRLAQALDQRLGDGRRTAFSGGPFPRQRSREGVRERGQPALQSCSDSGRSPAAGMYVDAARRLVWYEAPVPALSVALPFMMSVAARPAAIDPRLTESMRTLSVAPARSPLAISVAKARASCLGKACCTQPAV